MSLAWPVSLRIVLVSASPALGHHVVCHHVCSRDGPSFSICVLCTSLAPPLLLAEGFFTEVTDACEWLPFSTLTSLGLKYFGLVISTLFLCPNVPTTDSKENEKKQILFVFT